MNKLLKNIPTSSEILYIYQSEINFANTILRETKASCILYVENTYDTIYITCKNTTIERPSGYGEWNLVVRRLPSQKTNIKLDRTVGEKDHFRSAGNQAQADNKVRSIYSWIYVSILGKNGGSDYVTIWPEAAPNPHCSPNSVGKNCNFTDLRLVVNSPALLPKVETIQGRAADGVQNTAGLLVKNGGPASEQEDSSYGSPMFWSQFRVGGKPARNLIGKSGKKKAKEGKDKLSTLP